MHLTKDMTIDMVYLVISGSMRTEMWQEQQLLWIRLTKRRLEMVVVIHCGFCGRRSVSLANGEQAYTTGSIAHLSKDI